MVSQLNISIPREGNPTTAEERNNWSIASSEIGACQAALATIESAGGAGNATSIMGIPINVSPPLNGTFLSYNGTDITWTLPPATVSMGGDVVGLSNATTVARINGIAVQGSPSVGQVLTFNGTNLGYQNITAPSLTSVSMGGDVQGQSNAAQVTALYGRPIANVSPSNGQSLAWNGAAYAPTTISGIAPNLAIGTVTNVSTGQTATASITGTNPNYVLNLGLPIGATGATGQTGTAGTPGVTGPAGPAPNLAMGTVTTGAAGTTAAASITGTSPNYTLSLTIPQGQPGSASPPGSITMAGDIGGTAAASIVQAIHGTPVVSTAPQNGQVLQYNGTNYAPATISGGPGGVSFPIAGTNASAQPPASGSLLHIANNDATNTSMQVDSSGNGVSAIEFRKMGGTMASPAMPGANSQIGFLRWQGYVGAGAGDGSTNFGAGAEIQVLTGPSAWSGSAMATIVQFLTTAASESASSGKTIKMYIGQNGGLVVGNAAGGDMGPGTINIAAGVYVNGIQLTVP